MKITLTILIITLSLFIGSCSYEYTSEKYQDEFDCITMGEQIIIFNEDIMTVTIKSVEKIDEHKAIIMLTAINKTHREFTLDIIPFRLNNTVIYKGSFKFNIEYADSKVTTECPLIIDLDELTDDSIEGILNTFSFIISITDKGWRVPLYQDTLTLHYGELRRDMILPSDNLIGSDDYFDIYFAGASEIDGVETYGVLIYNKTDEPLYFEIMSLAINNISLPTRYKTKIESKSYYYYSETELSFEYRYKSFLSNYKKALCIEVDLRCYGYDAKTQLSAIQDKLILDDSINVVTEEPLSTVIYNKNDVNISTSRYIMPSPSSSDIKMGIGWKVINNSDNSIYIFIKNISVIDILTNEANDEYNDINISFSLLPDTCSEVLPVHDTLLISNAGYLISVDVVFHDGSFHEIIRETIIFALDAKQLLCPKDCPFEQSFNLNKIKFTPVHSPA